MSYLEKDFQTEFCKWAKYNIKETAAFELKFTRSLSLPFSDVQEHQINALYNAKHHYLIHKIPDAGYQNPFDCFFLKGCNAYVVIMFTKQKTFYLIDIDDFIQEKNTSVRKSLTQDRAAQIGAQGQLSRMW